MYSAEGECDSWGHQQQQREKNRHCPADLAFPSRPALDRIGVLPAVTRHTICLQGGLAICAYFTHLPAMLDGQTAFAVAVPSQGFSRWRLPDSRPLCKRRPLMAVAAPVSTVAYPAQSSRLETVSSQAMSVASSSVDVEPVTPISGSAEFLHACQQSVKRLVIVQVKAPWCRSCKALDGKVRRLAREYSEEVFFYSMNFEDPENKPIAYQLGVKNMPTFMFFQGEYGQVEQFTCGPNRAAMLREKIEIYMDGECPYTPAE